jgi:glycosyltransferase involved in cell wall biosynthesis
MVSGGRPMVSVIIPTLAQPERLPGLIRAIENVASQQGVRGLPIVVVNGAYAAAELTQSLTRRHDLRLITRAESGLPQALNAGRAAVETPYFSVLDDDDELLPGALTTRVRALDAHPDADMVVTNGYVEGFGRRKLNVQDFCEIERDPVRTLLQRNWLRPCAGTFRTRTITLDFFEHIPAYREWTYLGLRFVLERTVRFLSAPTFVYHTDTSGSLSKSKAYSLAGPRAIAEMQRLNPPRHIQAMLRAHLTADLHGNSERERLDGNHAAAWAWHLRCLARFGGWRYLSYTRHLLWGSVRGLVAALGRPGRPS